MARKTYRTYFLKNYVTAVKDKAGHRIEVVFRGGIQVDSTAKFTTEDKDIQKVLESRSGFGRDYYLESTEKTEEPAPAPVKEEKVAEPEKPLTDVKDIKRFRNLVEMRAYMAEIGLPVKDDSNYMECKAIASKEGYDFQIKRA